MADEKELSPEEKAKKDREQAVAEQDNPPQPYPTPEQLNKQQAEGGPIDDDDGGDDAAAKRSKADDAKKTEEAKATRAVEAGKPSGGGYTTR